MILELDTTYVREEWLPQLIRQYLDPTGHGLAEVVVTAPGANRPPILELGGGQGEAEAAEGQPPVVRGVQVVEEEPLFVWGVREVVEDQS